MKITRLLLLIILMLCAYKMCTAQIYGSAGTGYVWGMSGSKYDNRTSSVLWPLAIGYKYHMIVAETEVKWIVGYEAHIIPSAGISVKMGEEGELTPLIGYNIYTSSLQPAVRMGWKHIFIQYSNNQSLHMFEVGIKISSNDG